MGPWAWCKAPTPGPITPIAYILFKNDKQRFTVKKRKMLQKYYIQSFFNNLKNHILNLKKSICGLKNLSLT
jgi:hypothetical protein